MNQEFINTILKEATKAFNKGEVPVGAIIVKDGEIVAKAHNLIEKKKDATMHAEIIAIKKASKKLNNWRLNDCEMYVTLQPCSMCMSAIELSRIKKVYYLVKRDKDINFDKNKYNLIDNEESDTALNLIQKFFKNRR